MHIIAKPNDTFHRYFSVYNASKVCAERTVYKHINLNQTEVTTCGIYCELFRLCHLSRCALKASTHVIFILPHSRSGLCLELLGVVHTPVKSSAFPSMVFILRKMSALLQVDRAGESLSGLSGRRASLLCGETAQNGGKIIASIQAKHGINGENFVFSCMYFNWNSVGKACC